MVLDLLRIFVSWPFVALVLGLLFGACFRDELKQFFNNVASVRLPGGAEITTSQPPPPDSETDSEPAPQESNTSLITLNEDQVAEIRAHIEGLAEKANLAEQIKDSVIENEINHFEELNLQKKYWWFMYLSIFLVRNTIWVLRWFSYQTTPPTKEFYGEYWGVVIGEPKEREIIIMVLLHHGLVENEGPVYKITQDGRDLLSFIGGLEAGAK